MKGVKFPLAGKERYLCFTAEAMFQLQDLFGGTGELLELTQQGTREGFTAACKAAAVLAEQGELVRRSLGYDPEPMVSAEAIAATTDPMGITALKLLLPSVISLGYGREVEPENDEVDLSLAELNEQKKRGDPGGVLPDRGRMRILPAGDHAVHAGRNRGCVGAVPAG